MKIDISNSINYPIGIGSNERMVFISVAEAEALCEELGKKLPEYKVYRKEMNELGNTPADKDYKPSGISRAEEMALKAYPINMTPLNYQDLIDMYGGKTEIDTNSFVRAYFQKGYEQAEKDLALTIEDIERIDIMLCGTRANKCGAFTFSKLSDEQYTEVLTRFKQIKEK